MKDDAKTVQIQYDQYLQERNGVLDDVERLEEKLAGKNVEAAEIIREANTFETRISRIGGGFASKREDLRTKKSFLEMKNASLQNDLRSMLAGPDAVLFDSKTYGTCKVTNPKRRENSEKTIPR